MRYVCYISLQKFASVRLKRVAGEALKEKSIRQKYFFLEMVCTRWQSKWTVLFWIKTLNLVDFIYNKARQMSVSFLTDTSVWSAASEEHESSTRWPNKLLAAFMGIKFTWSVQLKALTSFDIMCILCMQGKLFYELYWFVMGWRGHKPDWPISWVLCQCFI